MATPALTQGMLIVRGEHAIYALANARLFKSGLGRNAF